MRKFFAFIIFLALAVIFIPWLHPAGATDQGTTVDVYDQQKNLVKSVVFRIGVPYYVVNDQTPGTEIDVAPFIESDRTFVPVRFLGNALGVDDSNIAWDNPTQTAILKGNATLQMTIGQARITSDGQAKDIDVAPLLRSDRTFLPARYVAEGLGYQVEWDEATQIVVCWPAGQPKPDVSGAVAYLTEFVEQQPQQPVVEGETFTTRAGYQIPKETNLAIPQYLNELGPGDPNNCEMNFNIDLTKGDLESQWADAAAILSQKIDSQTVDEIIAYVKQKTERNKELEYKRWETGDKKIGVGSSWGSYGIQITVWFK